jgi:LDH2 family malate/lactate/ureidoglycolate dehydrogenase
MNQPPQDFVLIPVADLRQLAADCLNASGLRPDHATQLAQLLTNGDLRGVRSHGTRQLRGYCPMLREGHINPNPELVVLKDTSTAVLIGGDGGLGYAPMMEATERAIPKAKQSGIAVAASCQHGHYGSAGHYVRRAMEDSCCAFSVQGSSQSFGEPDPNPARRPPSATWGNPPICFGMPGADEPPFVLDAATCILGGENREHLDHLQALIPAAFFKSMGYTAVARSFGGPLVGTASAIARQVAEQWPNATSGGLVVIIDIGLFTDPGEVRRSNDDMVRGVRETMKPVTGYREATLPGTPEYRNERDYGRDGIPIGTEDAELLRKTAAECGVELPEALRPS